MCPLAIRVGAAPPKFAAVKQRASRVQLLGTVAAASWPLKLFLRIPSLTIGLLGIGLTSIVP